MTKLLVALARAARRDGESNLPQNFTRLQRSREQLSKKFVSLDGAIALRTGHHNLCIQRNYCCRPISGWVGMRQAATDCPFVADLHIAQMSGRLRQQRADAPQQVR